jgi:uncharacterized membrane protein YfcA
MHLSSYSVAGQRVFKNITTVPNLRNKSEFWGNRNLYYVKILWRLIMISQLSNPWWVFILLGIGAGIISGTLGLGSGTVIVPVLILLCGFEQQKSSQGIALAVMVPMALVGALRYWKNPEIEINAVIVGLIICGALAGVLVGTELASRLPSHTLRKVFAIYLVIVAVIMFTASPKPEKQDLGESLTNQKNVNLGEREGIKNEAPKQ